MKKNLVTFSLIAIACMLAFCAGCSSVSDPSSSATSAPATTSSSQTTPDGEYEANVVLEGGSGKASVESPARIVSKSGSLTATIVWSSSHYDQMLVDGVQYLPVNTEGNSTFEIPIPSLDAELAVQAETTAMSTPHMIDYTLRFSSSDSTAEGDEDESSESQRLADFHNPDLGNGWLATRSMELEYAKCFTVDYYEGGYALACLSDGGRYLMVPDGADTPAGIASDIVVLQKPMDRIYLVASDTICLFDALDEMDAIAVSGIAKENWKIPAAVKAMEDGSIAYGGKYSAPDYDVLLAKGVRLAIESTMINHTPDVRDKLIELGIPVLTEQSSYETEPLGRSEWVKLYGALFDKEDLATELFDAQVEKAGAIESARTGKTVAFFYINSNGAAVVRKPGDYVTRMIDLAGGDYIFNSLGDDSSTSSVTLEMERFYTQAKDADIIIYNSTIDAGVDSMSDLVGKNELLTNFKAVKEGDVWICGQDMYQQMLATGDIIADFHAAFTGTTDGLEYLQKL